LGLPEEALGYLGESLQIFASQPVERQARIPPRWAKAKLRQGKAFHALHRLPEALESIERSIYMTRRLILDEEKAYLTRSLAYTLAEAGRVLIDLSEPLRAHNYLGESMSILFNIVSEGRHELTPDLVQIVTLDFDLNRRDANWDGAAKAACAIAVITDPYFKDNNMSQDLYNAMMPFVKAIRNLSQDEKSTFLPEITKINDEARKIIQKIIQLWMEQ
jgi:tetratricopeptide (TPR) repeat protein